MVGGCLQFCSRGCGSVGSGAVVLYGGYLDVVDGVGRVGDLQMVERMPSVRRSKTEVAMGPSVVGRGVDEQGDSATRWVDVATTSVWSSLLVHQPPLALHLHWHQ